MLDNLIIFNSCARDLDVNSITLSSLAHLIIYCRIAEADSGAQAVSVQFENQQAAEYFAMGPHIGQHIGVNAPQLALSLLESKHIARCLSHGRGNGSGIIQRTIKLTL